MFLRFWVILMQVRAEAVCEWCISIMCVLFCVICVYFSCTQCVLWVWLHPMTVYFFLIVLWHMSQVHVCDCNDCWCVVGPGFDSTSPVRSRASWLPCHKTESGSSSSPTSCRMCRSDVAPSKLRTHTHIRQTH